MSYNIPTDGYVFFKDECYFDKIYLGKTDSIENYEEVEVTSEIINATPGLYRKYTAGSYYEKGAHIIYDSSLITLTAEIEDAEEELDAEAYTKIMDIKETTDEEEEIL